MKHILAKVVETKTLTSNTVETVTLNWKLQFSHQTLCPMVQTTLTRGHNTLLTHNTCHKKPWKAAGLC